MFLTFSNVISAKKKETPTLSDTQYLIEFGILGSAFGFLFVGFVTWTFLLRRKINRILSDKDEKSSGEMRAPIDKIAQNESEIVVTNDFSVPTEEMPTVTYLDEEEIIPEKNETKSSNSP